MGEGERLARRARRNVLSVALLANLLGGAVVLVFLQWVSVGGGAPHRDTRVSVVLGTAYALVSTVLVYGGAVRSFTTSVGWLAAGRRPAPDERAATLAQPARLTLLFFAAWVGGALLFGILDGAVFPTPTARTIQVAATTLLGGLTSCMVFFLVIERRLRPVFALALAGTPPARPATIGIRPRLVLSWVLGSGVVLTELLVLPLTGTRHGPPHLAASVAFLSGAGLLAGIVLTVVAAGSVADPIEEVRAGLRRVQAGDLDVSVTVDDGGEVGLLQAGFNQMVDGLRERLLLRDLLDHHIGDEVARYAIERGVGLGGEVRNVSALFVDVIGSTGIAQERPATEVVALLNELFGLVVRAVTAEGGWVNKFEGDAALCVFGAPDDQPDHAARALRAARQLRDSLAAWATAGGLDTAIGVSSGITVAGNVGSEQRYEYTVIGDPVNEAARLSELAKATAGRVVAGAPSVAAAAGRAGTWLSGGSQVLRGRSEPTELFVPAPADQPLAGRTSSGAG